MPSRNLQAHLLYAASLLAAALFAGPSDGKSADEGVKQDSRRVWVLTDQGGAASEGGASASGAGGIIPYEITCSAGQLLSAQRKLTSAGVYGAATWTVRISASVSSENGARMLQTALENVCRSG